jgi:RNA recognition motif-containing protein
VPTSVDPFEVVAERGVKPAMSLKLYVGGLSFETTDAELRTLFEQAGTVESATVITDRLSGRSKGFGFVEMSTDAEARQAITELNGKTLGERTITVEEARPPREGRGGPRGGSGGRGRW